MGGTHGCTHLRELLGQMATTAFQTLYPARRAREKAQLAKVARGEAPAAIPSLLGTCIAYAPDSPVSIKRWPHLANAAETAATEG